MKFNYILASVMLGMVLMATGCQCNRQQAIGNYDNGMDTVPALSDEMQADLNKSKTILYTLPSPVEMANLIKETGLSYDEDIFNPLSKVSKYTTNFQMAVNLGIYTTDMSMASMFNQSQQTMEYLQTIRQLTDKLGIVNIVDENNLAKFEDKEASKEEILNVISEVYINANQYLTENNRKNIAVMVLTGGWVEGFYIAMHMQKQAKQKQLPAIRERILAQKLSLATVIDIITDCNKNGDDEDLDYLYMRMNELKLIFDEVRFETSEAPVVDVRPTKKLTRIKAPAQGELTVEILDYLGMKVAEIRDEFVK